MRRQAKKNNRSVTLMRGPLFNPLLDGAIWQRFPQSATWERCRFLHRFLLHCGPLKYEKSKSHFAIKSSCLTPSESGIQNVFRDSWDIPFPPKHEVHSLSLLSSYLRQFKSLNRMRCQRDSETNIFLLLTYAQTARQAYLFLLSCSKELRTKNKAEMTCQWPNKVVFQQCISFYPYLLLFPAP